MTSSNKIPCNWPDGLDMADDIEAVANLALNRILELVGGERAVEALVKIPLGDKAIVEVEDGYNYTLKARHVKGSGDETWRGAGHFNSLEGAVGKAITLRLASEDDVTEIRGVIKGIFRTVQAAREVTRDLRANVDDLRQLKELLARPTISNLDKARNLVGRALT
jgi:hypothetical protein